MRVVLGNILLHWHCPSLEQAAVFDQMRPIRQKAVAICVKKAHGECDGGTFVSCLHDSEADCLRRIAEINPPVAKRR